MTKQTPSKDRWFLDERGNACFIPQGWADHFDCEYGEWYGYYPTHTCSNSPVATGHIGCASLLEMREVTEEDARKSHPEMARYLDAINNGDDPDAALVSA